MNTLNRIWILIVAVALSIETSNVLGQGPASHLLFLNDTQETVVLRIYRPGYTYQPLPFGPGDNRQFPLSSNKDDRVLIASKASAQTFQVLACSSFNPSQATFPELAAVLIEDNGNYVIVYFVKSESGLEPLGNNERNQRIGEEAKERVMKAMQRMKEEQENPAL